MYKKTKEVFNTFLAGKSDSGERGMALLRKLNKPEKYHIDCMDSYGETILMKAVRKNNRDLVDFLLVQGANIIHQDLVSSSLNENNKAFVLMRFDRRKERLLSWSRPSQAT